MSCNDLNFVNISDNCPYNATLQFCGEPKARKVILDFDLTSSSNGTVISNGNNTFTGTNTFSGNVSLNGNNVIGNAPTDTLGFFGATPVARPTALTQIYSTADDTLAALTSVTLTDSTTGTANTTVQDVTNAFNQTILNNNFADLTQAYNQLKADHDDLAQFVNSLVDKLQSLGLLA
jgi:hypothetical protein